VARVGAYLAERAAMGGKDVIHGYLDGDGGMFVELRASDVLLLVNTMEHAPGVTARRRFRTARLLCPSSGMASWPPIQPGRPRAADNRSRMAASHSGSRPGP
jgi:hypothetical protein